MIDDKKLKEAESRVSHNLKCLENCGFVESSRDGNYRIYSLNKETIVPIVDLFKKHINKYKERLTYCEVIQR